MPGLVVGSAHSSHSYAQGTNLYITFVMKPADFVAGRGRLPRRVDADVMEATLAAGGTIAHHHGIGRLRAPWLERELGHAPTRCCARSSARSIPPAS